MSFLLNVQRMLQKIQTLDVRFAVDPTQLVTIQQETSFFYSIWYVTTCYNRCLLVIVSIYSELCGRNMFSAR